MKWVSALSLVAALAFANGESNGPRQEILRPQPRQIFRDGFGEERESFNSRRPTIKDRRQRKEPPSVGGQLPLGPRPSYSSESRFDPEERSQPEPHMPNGVEAESLFDLAAFSGSNSPQRSQEKSSKHEPEEEEYDEENTEELPEYLQSEEQYITEDHDEPALNYVDEEQYREETRSPAHRYPDEESTTESSYKPSARGKQKQQQQQQQQQQRPSSEAGERYATPIPNKENEFDPFSLFDHTENEDGYENDPPKKQDSGEQFHQGSSKFEVAADPYLEKRFQQNPRAQNRNYETRAPPRTVEQRKQTPSFNLRPASRHIPKQKVNQALNQNLIPRDPYYEEQRPSRPVGQHRPQRIRNEDRQSYAPPENNYNPEDYQDYEDDENKPDRLSELLLLSKFKCGGRNDGYYADEDVNCEVFHFCQDGVKHSWLCPNGAAFHQVHLICMPHSEDNICERSSNFHFVNDFLYKEVGDHPQNMSYVQRYYPQGYESGVANIPHHEKGFPPPQAPQTAKHYNRPLREQRPHPPPNYQTRPNVHKARTESQRPSQYDIQARRNSEGHHRQRQEQAPEGREQQRPSLVRQESVDEERFQPQDLSSQQYREEGQFKPSRPQFKESPEFLERPQERRPPHEAFGGSDNNNQHFKRPQFKQGSERPDLSIVEGASGHSQHNRAQPGSGNNQFLQSREQLYRPNSNIRPTPVSGHEPPVYHPQQFFPGQGRTQTGAASAKHSQFRLSHEGRRHPPRKESSLNPLSFLG